MVNPQGTSFIPQRPVRGKADTRRTRKIYVLAYIAYVMFFGSLIAAGFVVFFQLSLDVQLEEARTQLAQERQQFNQGDIERVRDLDKRISIAQERLNNHVSVLSIFEALERNSVQSLQYVAFSYQRLNDAFPEVSFTGTSDRFNNVLFQRDIFASNPILAGSAFKEVILTSAVEGESSQEPVETVTFTLTKDVDTSLIGYQPRNGLQEEVESIQGAEQNAQTSESSEITDIPVVFEEVIQDDVITQ